MRVAFYKELLQFINNISKFNVIKFNTLPSDNEAIGVIDRPAVLGSARINHERDITLQFDVMIKSKSSLEPLSELERIAKALDMQYVGKGYITLYTTPQFAYKDDNGAYVYVSSFNAEIER